MSRRVIVHLVHGTWPYGLWTSLLHNCRILRRLCRCGRKAFIRRRLQERLWFQPRSEFRKEVAARAGIPLRFASFRWSGSNSFTARSEASAAFRQHLELWLGREPDACHLVVAHSHGGTVTIGAAADPNQPLSRPLAGIITMATPFVTLRLWSAGADASFRAVAASFAPYFLLGAVACLGIAIAIGGEVWSSFVALFAGTIVMILAIAGARKWSGRSFTKLHSLLQTQVLRPALPCDLVVLRTPGDEASLSIAAAQVVDLVTTRLWRMLASGVRGLLNSTVNRVPSFVATVAIWLLCALGYTVWWWLSRGEMPSVFQIIIAGPYIAGIIVFVLGAFLMVAPLLVYLLAALALALATGYETLQYMGITRVDAEPLPPASSAFAELLPLTDEQRESMTMRHSLHELAVARERVGDWIRTKGT